MDDLTLGQRLSAAGQRLSAGHLTALSWAAALAPVLARSDALNRSGAGRFERAESVVRGQPTAPHSGPAVPPARPVAGRAAAGERRPAADRPDETAGPATVPAPDGPATDDVQLPADVRSRLREVAGTGADRVRIRGREAGDAVARAEHADGVAIGTAVHLRAGHYRPDTPEGFALLAHETAHVTALLARGGADPRTTPGGAGPEETWAREVEHRVRALGTPPGGVPAGRAAAPPFPGGGGHRGRPADGPGRVPSPGLLSVPAPAPPVPQRAAADRPPPVAPPPFDVEALRSSLIDDLMRRVRTDFERGG